MVGPRHAAAGARCRLSDGSAMLVALAALVPLVVSSDFLVRIGVNGMLLALLAVGLNVSVGWAGLLDLGFVAFYGFGAYTFALLSSDQLGIHLPTLLAVPIVILATGLLGLVLGLPSWRLSGDYLAIVTLFFSQIFLELTLNFDRLGVDLTGGPNGISGVDPFSFLGFEFSSPTSYFYLLLVLVAVIVTMLYLVDRSRTGRAWRALRDDPLAAEIMTVPIRRLKLMAFATGAAVAGPGGQPLRLVPARRLPAELPGPVPHRDLRRPDPRGQRQPRRRGRGRDRRDARARPPP